MSEFRQLISPNPLFPKNGIRIFLAGTIEMGKSINWQKSYALKLRKEYLELGLPVDLTIFNPRRKSFSPESGRDQILWELNRLEESDIIVMNILPDSMSMISLLELGLYSRSSKLIVVCNSDYSRYDNVELTCKRYRVPLYDSLDQVTLPVILDKLL